LGGVPRPHLLIRKLRGEVPEKIQNLSQTTADGPAKRINHPPSLRYGVAGEWRGKHRTPHSEHPTPNTDQTSNPLALKRDGFAVANIKPKTSLNG